MSLYSYYRISKPSAGKVPPGEVEGVYKSLRNRTFWGATIAYSLYYVCRMSINVVKQPLIDEGVLTAGQLGLIGSALLFVYAVGKFMNGFIADYCNIRRFMATGLCISALLNLVIGALGLFTYMIPPLIMFVSCNPVGGERMDAVYGLGPRGHQSFALVPAVETRFILQSFQLKPLYRRIHFI